MEEIAPKVEEGAAAFAKYEADIATFAKFDMRGLCKAVNAAGKIGFLDAQRIAAEFEAMAARHRAETFAMHSALTKRAQELGIDLPVIAGGGDR